MAVSNGPDLGRKGQPTQRTWIAKGLAAFLAHQGLQVLMYIHVLLQSLLCGEALVAFRADMRFIWHSSVKLTKKGTATATYGQYASAYASRSCSAAEIRLSRDRSGGSRASHTGTPCPPFLHS